MSWLISNLGTISVALVIAAIVTLIIVKHFKDKKAGKSSCSGGCKGCPLNGKCR